MTDTPTRAEVEELISHLRDWPKNDLFQNIIDTLTALPLAYTETGETWRGKAYNERQRAEAAERRLAEVEAELELLKEKQK